MNSASISKYIFILNPTAGKHQSLFLKEKILERFTRDGLADSCVFLFTEKPQHATELAHEQALLYGDCAIIYACGGDGTINEVANGLIGTESYMSVIPAGTGNDWIKSVYSTRDPLEVIERIFDYKIKKIDAGKLDNRYFINMASLGFDTIVGDRAKEMVAKFKFLGGFSYFLAIFVCLFGKYYSTMKYEFECIDSDGKEYTASDSKNFVLAAIANGKFYGGMFNPCPNADMSDGLMDVCIVDKISIPQVLAMIPKYISGKHLTHKAVHMFRVKKGIFEKVDNRLLVNCDGESFVEDSVKLSVVADALKVVYY